MVGMHVECRFVRDALKGDDAYEIRMRLQEHQPEHITKLPSRLNGRASEIPLLNKKAESLITNIV
eukprot:scaffold505423_cov34-Prasinocladus_malaysianus.AAC.1